MAFVAVHIGAGYHDKLKRSQYNRICVEACQAAMNALKNDATATIGVVEAIGSLENQTLTNAGIGSNLNLEGFVECDASLMDGESMLFGSVGAVKSIRNPIRIAQLILEQQKIPGPLGLIPPNFLVGQGAENFAISREESSKTYNKYKLQLDNFEKNFSLMHQHQCYDTVGAICIDKKGCLASGVSSGGLILKQEGRVGQVHFKVPKKNKNLNVLVFKASIVGADSCVMRNIPRQDHLAGLIGLILDQELNSIEFFWAHSTRTMCIGYMDSHSSSPISFVSEMQSEPGSTIIAQSKTFRFQ
ncbi:threonine aspartase 1-like protein [Sarcoptes scabiei]|uniref:Threonine aspartase 1-like protein n=1 Tax=Sarcoptes scabiei TaxID=52283 RepID=A0A131ZZW6_SARSC|nr:threonine aspartase 1-like protein [Sarcoptes scabiei]